MLGAVGAYDWSGTVIQESSNKVTTFPSQAFEQILQDRNHSSYLGKGLKYLLPNMSEFYPSYRLLLKTDLGGKKNAEH